jgi:hypothetical protein
VRTVSLPLRITRDGQLDRGEGTDQVIRLIQAMAATTATTWPHAPWFGLFEQFNEANLGLQEQPGLVDALNAALRNLGAAWAEVQRVRTAADRAQGERRFDITLLIDGEQAVHGTIAG